MLSKKAITKKPVAFIIDENIRHKKKYLTQVTAFFLSIKAPKIKGLRRDWTH